MRSLLAAMLAAVAMAGGTALPAEASAGAGLRGAVDREAARHGNAAAETARLQLARATFDDDDDDDDRPTRRWRRNDRRWDRWDGEWYRPRRHHANRHAYSAPRGSRAGKQARRTSIKQRRAAHRSRHRTARATVRHSRRTTSSWSAPAGRDITGMASYYWQGRRTATGERYNPDGLTAAHRSLPFGTRVRVTHLGNGRSVDVRINDRGPFIGGRIIDLSRGAAGVLGMRQQGVARVKVTVLGR